LPKPPFPGNGQAGSIERDDPEALQLINEVARAALDKKATRPVAVMVGEVVEGLADAFVVVSAPNVRHVRTVVEEIEKQARSVLGRSPRATEGLDDATWVLVDFGDVVVHVFLEETRRYYDLEHLWKAARQRELTESPGEARTD
jgi:ribosome-associated protein